MGQLTIVKKTRFFCSFSALSGCEIDKIPLSYLL